MTFLIEKLIGESVARQDMRRMATIVRPQPVRPRDILDLIAAQGRTATFEGLARALELKHIEPRATVFVALGRWPTAEELARIPEPYNARAHLRELMQGQEFRSTFFRRLLDMYADRRRLIHVRIPRCANDYLATGAATAHPVLPLDFGARPTLPLHRVFETLSTVLYRFGVANTIFFATEALAPLFFPPETRPVAPDTLGWCLDAPPARLTDLVFAVMRDPEAILLSAANAILGRLEMDAANDTREIAVWRARLGTLPSGRDAGWTDVGRRLIAELPYRDPICTALGDGTAERALTLARISGITLVGIESLSAWSRTAIGCESTDPTNVSKPRLRAGELDSATRALLRERTGQDRIFYDRFAAVSNPAESLSVPGTAL